MFWGDRFARVVDPYGHSWQIATHVEDIEPEEMERRSRRRWRACRPELTPPKELPRAQRGELLVLHLEDAVERQVADLGERNGRTPRGRSSRRARPVASPAPGSRSAPPGGRRRGATSRPRGGRASRTPSPSKDGASAWWKTSKTTGKPSRSASARTGSSGQRSSFSSTSRPAAPSDSRSKAAAKRRARPRGRRARADVEDDPVRAVRPKALSNRSW